MRSYPIDSPEAAARIERREVVTFFRIPEKCV